MQKFKNELYDNCYSNVNLSVLYQTGSLYQDWVWSLVRTVHDISCKVWRSLCMEVKVTGVWNWTLKAMQL
jgi:hypothetical protein